MIKEKLFEFLINEYNLKYTFQRFDHYPFGNWSVDMYSYYNDSGCFSIYNLAQRGEVDYFYAKNFSSNINELMYQRIDIESIGEEIWNESKRKIFFRYRHTLFHKTLADVIKNQIIKNGEFFGIKV